MFESAQDSARVNDDVRTLERAVASSAAGRGLLLVNDCGSLQTAPNRLVVFGREAMACDVEGSSTPSRNQALAQGFIAALNGGNIAQPYVSMMDLPAGKALMRLCRSDTPIEILADGNLYASGSIAGNGALIDLIARKFAEQGSGIFTASTQSAAPNTFLRCVEMHALRENRNYTGVRVLAPLLQTSTDSGSQNTGSVGDRVLSVDEWCIKQKAEWWQASFNQIKAYVEPHAGPLPPLFDPTIEIARVRFLGELYHAERELRYLEQSTMPRVTVDPEARLETDRLAQGLEYIERFPALLSAVDEPHVAFYLAKMFVYDIPEDAKERQYALGEGTDGACIGFVNDQIRGLIKRVELGSHRAQLRL